MKPTRLQQLPNLSAPQPAPPGCEAGAQSYRLGACAIIVGHSPAGWHLSISCASRYPTWDEIAKARYALIPPDVTMALLLPPEAEYINLHATCLHLWEVAPADKQPCRLLGLPVTISNARAVQAPDTIRFGTFDAYIRPGTQPAEDPHGQQS